MLDIQCLTCLRLEQGVCRGQAQTRQTNENRNIRKGVYRIQRRTARRIARQQARLAMQLGALPDDFDDWNQY